MHHSFNSTSDRASKRNRDDAFLCSLNWELLSSSDKTFVAPPSTSKRLQQRPVVSQLERSGHLFVLSWHRLILLSSKQMKTIHQLSCDARAWNCSSCDYRSEKCCSLQMTPTFIAYIQCCQFRTGIICFACSLTCFKPSKLMLSKEKYGSMAPDAKLLESWDLHIFNINQRYIPQTPYRCQSFSLNVTLNKS